MGRVAAAEVLDAARAGGYAVGAFNVSNMETVQAVVAAAERVAAPVMLQVSPGAIDYAGYETITGLAFDAARRARVPVVVHLDHCRDPQVVLRAVHDGYDSVMFDGSRLPLAENVAHTRVVVAAARPLGIAVEAELGVIGGIEDTDPEVAATRTTTPDEAARFVADTGIDILAPALGNLHRMPDDSTRIDPALVRAIARATGVPIALHGASGIARDQLGALIEAGVAKVNVSSRVTRALAAGIRATWATDPGVLDLRRFLGEGRRAVAEQCEEYLVLTGSAGRAPGGSGDVTEHAWSAAVVEAE